MPAPDRKFSYEEISNGALLLSLLRKCESFEALCEKFEYALPPNLEENTAAMMLYQRLHRMRSVGLVEFEEHIVHGRKGVVGLKLTPLWSKIRVALGGMSLSEVAMLSRHGKGMGVEPVFGRPRRPQTPEERVDVFVLMPFATDPGEVYWEHIKAMGADLNIRIERSDERFAPGPFFEKVWNGINAARLILAICSEINPNVFYEIGIAHTIGKKVVLLTRAELAIPSDVGHFDRIDYTDDPERIQAMLLRLRGYFQRTLGV